MITQNKYEESQNNNSTFRITMLFGQLIGAISLFLGFAFFLLGLTGSLDLVIEAANLKAKMINASPGVVFIIAGVFILWRYKPKKSKTITEEKTVTANLSPKITIKESEFNDESIGKNDATHVKSNSTEVEQFYQALRENDPVKLVEIISNDLSVEERAEII